MCQNMAKNALLRWGKNLKRAKFRHVFSKYFKNGPFCHSKTYLFIYKPMNRVQKQHNLDQIFYFEKIRGKIIFLPCARAWRGYFKPEKILVNIYSYAGVYFY